MKIKNKKEEANSKVASVIDLMMRKRGKIIEDFFMIFEAFYDLVVKSSSSLRLSGDTQTHRQLSLTVLLRNWKVNFCDEIRNKVHNSLSYLSLINRDPLGVLRLYAPYRWQVTANSLCKQTLIALKLTIATMKLNCLASYRLYTALRTIVRWKDEKFFFPTPRFES